MNDREMEAWLKKVPVLTAPRDDVENAALQEILGGKGLTCLLGLVFGSRQALYAQLSYANMGSDEGRWRAAVLQGKIQGLELAIETVRQLGVPTTSDGQPNKEPK